MKGQTMSDKLKRAQVKELPTETLNAILGSQGLDGPSAEFPLRGIIRIDGIGHVPMKWLREELLQRA